MASGAAAAAAGEGRLAAGEGPLAGEGPWAGGSDAACLPCSKAAAETASGPS